MTAEAPLSVLSRGYAVAAAVIFTKLVVGSVRCLKGDCLGTVTHLHESYIIVQALVTFLVERKVLFNAPVLCGRGLE